MSSRLNPVLSLPGHWWCPDRKPGSLGEVRFFKNYELSPGDGPVKEEIFDRYMQAGAAAKTNIFLKEQSGYGLVPRSF